MQWVVTTAVIINWKVISDFLCHCLPPSHLCVEFSSLAFFLPLHLLWFSDPGNLPYMFLTSRVSGVVLLIPHCHLELYHLNIAVSVWLMYGVRTMSDPRGLQADGGCLGMSIVGEQYDIPTSLFSSLCFPMGSLFNTWTSRWLKRALCIHSYRLISQLLLISEDS